MKNYYFTFCGIHEHKNGYVKIIAKDVYSARERMFEVYNEKWGFQYSEEEFLPQIKQYGLYKVETLKAL